MIARGFQWNRVILQRTIRSFSTNPSPPSPIPHTPSPPAANAFTVPPILTHPPPLTSSKTNNSASKSSSMRALMSYYGSTFYHIAIGGIAITALVQSINTSRAIDEQKRLLDRAVGAQSQMNQNIILQQGRLDQLLMTGARARDVARDAMNRRNQKSQSASASVSASAPSPKKLPSRKSRNGKASERPIDTDLTDHS